MPLAQRRRRAAVALIVVVAVGAALQPVRSVPGTDPAGTVLYALAASLAFAVLLPRTSAWVPAALGPGSSLAVELFQLTGVPERLADAWPPIRLLLGEGFAWSDVVAYLVGGLVAWLALGALGWDRSTRPAVENPSTGLRR